MKINFAAMRPQPTSGRPYFRRCPGPTTRVSTAPELVVGRRAGDVLIHAGPTTGSVRVADLAAIAQYQRALEKIRHPEVIQITFPATTDVDSSTRSFSAATR